MKTNDVWSVRNAGWVLLGWSESEDDARATANEVDKELDNDATVRREPFDPAKHEEYLQIVGAK